MALSILISEPDDRWANEMKQFLELKSYSTERAMNGKDCQLRVYKARYLAVVLNLDTCNHSGLEVLKYLRLTAPSLKVILTLQSKRRLEELNVDKDNLSKLGASDLLIRPYTLEALLQSIEGANQFESWKEIKRTGPQKEEELIEANDSDFTRIKLEDFYSGNATIFDCYIRLAKNKYVRILHKGDFFEKTRINKYKEEKRITHLYFKTKERAVYINFINNVLSKMIPLQSEATGKKVKTAKSLTEKYIEEIYTEGLKPQLIEEGKKLCGNMYNLIQRSPDISDLMKVYEDYDPPAYAHLFLVSFISAITCKNLEWSSQRTVEMITFASLLHDVGKLKLPEEIRYKNKSELSPKEMEKFQEHPRLGAEMLQNFPLITEPVRQIVYQHHEYINGEGYPNGLAGVRIYPLAKVVSLADEFANLISRKKITPLQGLRELVLDREKIVRYDALVVKALIKGFIKDKR